MDSIFHEKQQGSLCAQHCLNTLLQGEYYTPVDLSSIAQSLDNEEKFRMAEVGTDTEDYRKFAMQPSGNVDDTGYFSVQVISSALEVWGLEMVPFISSDGRAEKARNNPSFQKAFICNYKDHWFTIRKLGRQWFNLNSLLPGPEVISDTYLDIFLAQLRQEGYSIFVIFGDFPNCEADIVLTSHPVPIKIDENASKSKLQYAASGSQQVKTQSVSEDDDLQAAIELSLKASSEYEVSTKQEKLQPNKDSECQLVAEQCSKAFLEGKDSCHNPNSGPLSEDQNPIYVADEDDDLKAAIELSLKGHVKEAEISPEDLREKRSAFLLSIDSNSDRNS